MSAEVAGAFGFGGEIVSGVPIAGQKVTVVIEVDWEEVSRRRGLGAVEPITDRSVLRALGELPLDLAVPWSSVDPVLAATLDTLPKGAVYADTKMVTRLFRPAARITGAISIGRNAARSLEEVSWLAADAPRGIGLARSGLQGAVVDRARSLGIGVAVTSGSQAEVVIKPSRRFMVPSGPRRWRNAELAYSKWIASAELAPSGVPPTL